MTKKDYILIARVFAKQARRRLTPDQRQLLEGTMAVMAKALSEDNPNFDRDIFLEASGHPSYQPSYLRK